MLSTSFGLAVFIFLVSWQENPLPLDIHPLSGHHISQPTIVCDLRDIRPFVMSLKWICEKKYRSTCMVLKIFWLLVPFIRIRLGYIVIYHIYISWIYT